MTQALQDQARSRTEAYYKDIIRITGAQPIDADILTEAETLLDLYGEDIRSRAYITQEAERGEMVLRPDFTVPIVKAHMAHGAEPARYCYMGKVFRKQYDTKAYTHSEYFQAGYEIFDRNDTLGADVEVFTLISRLLKPLTEKVKLRAAIGDIGILRATIEALPTSDRRKMALTRHLWRPKRFRTLLEQYSRHQKIPQRWQRLLTNPDSQEGIFMGSVQAGLRGRDEILARLQSLREETKTPPIPIRDIERIEALLSVRDKLPRAITALKKIVEKAPLGIRAAAQRLEERANRLAAAGINLEELDFEGSYGRTTMEYYDGFVFGFYAQEEPDMPAIASGGRYDALTKILGKGKAVPAIGGAIRPRLIIDLETSNPDKKER